MVPEPSPPPPADPSRTLTRHQLDARRDAERGRRLVGQRLLHELAEDRGGNCEAWALSPIERGLS
jgi:hypothetical protein